MNSVIRGAEPFAYEGNGSGVLVLHGFSSSPQSVAHLGEQLHRKFGFSVVGLRLPGHGTSSADMETTGYLDWIRAAEESFLDLCAQKSKVFIAGLSMGGCITLNLAARFPGKVTAIAPIAAPVGVSDGAFVEMLSLDPSPRFVPAIGSAIKADAVEEIAYDEIPTKCIRELMSLVTLTRSAVRKVACPIMVVQPREDRIVPPANAIEIVRSVGSDDIRLLWLQNSYHVATLDNDKDLIADRIGSFFSSFADCSTA